MATEGPSFDFAHLQAYLNSVLDPPVTEIEILADGLNLMLGVSTAEHGLTYVLRRPTKLRGTDLFTDLSVEYGILQRLDSTAVPAPRPVHYCEDATILDEEFFVMTALEGAGIDWGDPLPARFETPAQRRAVGQVMVDGLADIHILTTEGFADECPVQTPEDQIDAAQDRLASICDVLDREFPRLRRIGECLRRNAPSPSRTCLVHGDFKPDNVFFGASETPRLTGIVDWETAMLGDPLIEVGYLLLLWRDRTTATKPLSDLEQEAPTTAVAEYLADLDESGFWPFTLVDETVTRPEIVDRYEQSTGFSYENDRFYQAFSAYMLGVVWSDLYRYDVQSGLDREEPAYVTGIAMIAEDILHGPSRL